MNVIVHDNIVDSATHKKVYDWGQSVSWYTKPLMSKEGGYEKEFHNEGKDYYTEEREFNFPIQEYSPSLMGNHVTRPDVPNEHRSEVVSIHRHMIGWNDESVKERNFIIWDLWSRINDVVFHGKAKLDGMPENHLGLFGPKCNFIDQKNFHEKYNVPEQEWPRPGSIKRMSNGTVRTKPYNWTCFLNARHAPTGRRPSKGLGGRMGEIHKDSDNRISDKHFSVLYISNLEWRPLWGGHLEFYSDQVTGDKHWKHQYNIGWPEVIVGNVPNRIIVYPHDQAHMTRPPQPIAPEMTQKIAFRIKI